MNNLTEEFKLNNSIVKFSEKKKQNFRIANYYDELGKHSKAEKLRVCNSHPIFYRNNGKITFLTSLFCRERLCPTCAFVRSQKIGNNVIKILQHPYFNNSDQVFITLTIRNCKGSELLETVDKMLCAMSILVNSKRSYFKNYFDGVFYALEITYNKQDDTYHPHIHAICNFEKGTYAYRKNMKGKRIEIEDLAKHWGSALDVDYLPSVSIRKVYNSKHKQVREVAKYTVKGSDIVSVEVLKYVDEALYNRRIVSYIGKFREVKHLLKLDDEITTDKKSIKSIMNDTRIEKYILSWSIGFKSYEVIEETDGHSVSASEIVNEILDEK